MPYTLGLTQMPVIPAQTLGSYGPPVVDMAASMADPDGPWVTSSLGTATSPDDKLATAEAIYALLALTSSAASAFHGYRRNRSIGWAIVWGLLGGIFPVFTPTIALAQGFGKPRKVEVK
jgi:hypothetical protein